MEWYHQYRVDVWWWCMNSLNHHWIRILLRMKITLLVLVSKTSSFVWTSWTWGTMNLGQLTILPASNTKQVSHYIALFFAVQLCHVLVRTHFGWKNSELFQLLHIQGCNSFMCKHNTLIFRATLEHHKYQLQAAHSLWVFII